MPPSLPTVQTAFQSSTLRIIINILTIFVILIVIAACVSVGVIVGTNGIGGFTETSIGIVQSNITMVLDRPRTQNEIVQGYQYLFNNNNSTENVTYAFNSALNGSFSSLYLGGATSMLVPISSKTSNPSILRYTCNAKAFFKRNQKAEEIKDALDSFHPIITLMNVSGYLSSGPATFNHLLSNVTDTGPTNLTLDDLLNITVASGPGAFL